MVEALKGIVSISPEDRIAQLLILPSLHTRFPADSFLRTSDEIGTTGGNCVYLSLDMNDRPILKLTIEGKSILGLLDTGADRSIIALKDWSKGWPVQLSDKSLRGLGYAQAPQVSCRHLSWKDSEGHSGTFQPYVLDLPISLWGRDLMKDMGFQLSNKYSAVAQKIMQDMGYRPGLGLGKNLQGRRHPLESQQKLDRYGLGFS
ncbi:endogenous retrovirus group K member 7 Pro protein-like [Urocitellus parryii]